MDVHVARRQRGQRGRSEVRVAIAAEIEHLRAGLCLNPIHIALSDSYRFPKKVISQDET